MTKNKAIKRSYLDLVYDNLHDAKQPRTFYEIIDSIPELKALTGEERAEYIARLYTNMNLDGRFLSVGDNFWGLRGWYPVEQREEEVAMTLAPKRRKKKKADDDFDDYDELAEADYEELEDDDFVEDDFEEDEDFDEDDEDFEDLEEDEDEEEKDEDLDDTDDDIDDLDEDLDEDDEEK